ncbi:armadillo-like helical domain containing protein 1 [Xenia sp. Carnegie-2017]|uniref:armadillo-like helical domain containing protein 1 n=1 Tax=Xenia sp. Carnegie-2017 TaxID=2897299 RepID=UPI001F03F8EC|nr:armadillo-like helical domain containing protein 1 [Xenia sp. Carnegie-2017]XP_046848256.1 armadillo-like helical domain containing protein 1 [Xenia sp. Carnegie-2017]
MPTGKKDVAAVRKLLMKWDGGNKQTRMSILEDFIRKNENKTGPELDREFAQSASLFLTRLTAWLRMTYMVEKHVSLQLKAIRIFVGASSGHKFLTEFLEIGGVLTVLEILGLKQATEEDKFESLQLLLNIADDGRRFKELICESYGIQAVAECLAKSTSEKTQDSAKLLIQELATGNPKFQGQLYKALISLLRVASPKAQQIAAEILRIVQPMVKTTAPTIVDSVLMLLRSFHLEVQYEASELIKDLINYDVQLPLIKGLISLLKPCMKDVHVDEIHNDLFLSETGLSVLVYVQQAAACKMIRVLAQKSLDVAETFIQFRVIHSLLVALGNNKNSESQKQAAITLQFFMQSFSFVNKKIKESLGETFQEELLKNPDDLYTNLTPIQTSVLSLNKINIPEVAEAQE